MAALQEAPAPVEELRVDGTTQLGLIDFGGKQPQSATIALKGGAIELVDGQCFQKGDSIFFEGAGVVNFVGARDKHDPQTGIVTTAKQVHDARITDLQISSDERELILRAFRRFVGADRQEASALADELVEMAAGGIE